MTTETVTLIDDPDNKNVLELFVLVMQHWLTKVVMEDRFILNNTLMILEILIKSWSFCSEFKNRPAVEMLLRISKEPMLPTSTKTQILRISSALTGTVSMDATRLYTLASFDNSKGAQVAAPTLTQLHKSILDKNPFDDSKNSLKRHMSL